MSQANGYFEAYINQMAYRATQADSALIDAATKVVREVVPASQLHWAGSQRKGTAVVGSDLDLCMESTNPVTEADRRKLRSALEASLKRPALILSHAIRLPPHNDQPKVDIAFANAAFGSRPLPDKTAFHNQRARQVTARAMKLWTRSGGLPPMPGWVVEALVVHLDPNLSPAPPLDLFRKIVGWLQTSATPAVIEGVLKPQARPAWNPLWTLKLPGQIEAIQNHARALSRRKPQPEIWQSSADVGAWLGR